MDQTVGSVNQPQRKKPRPAFSKRRLTPALPVWRVPGFSSQRQTTPVTMKEMAMGKRKMLRKNPSPLMR